MRAAEEVFVTAIMSEYRVQDYEVNSTKVDVNLPEWVEEHRPEWIGLCACQTWMRITTKGSMTQTLVEGDHIKKTCKTCIRECREDGGACLPATQEELLGWQQDGIDYKCIGERSPSRRASRHSSRCGDPLPQGTPV